MIGAKMKQDKIDRRRIETLNEAIFNVGKAPNTIFENNKSVFYPKKKAGIEQAKEIVKKVSSNFGQRKPQNVNVAKKNN